MIGSNNSWSTTCGPKSLVRSMSELVDVMQATLRCGVAGDRTLYAGGQAFGPSAGNRPARYCRRDLVYRTDRLPVASAAERLSAVHYGARLFLRLARPAFVRA